LSLEAGLDSDKPPLQEKLLFVSDICEGHQTLEHLPAVETRVPLRKYELKDLGMTWVNPWVTYFNP